MLCLPPHQQLLAAVTKRLAKSLQACQRHTNEEHTGSPALLWAVVREAADGLVFPSPSPGLL